MKRLLNERTMRNKRVYRDRLNEKREDFSQQARGVMFGIKKQLEGKTFDATIGRISFQDTKLWGLELPIEIKNLEGGSWWQNDNNGKSISIKFHAKYKITGKLGKEEVSFSFVEDISDIFDNVARIYDYKLSNNAIVKTSSLPGDVLSITLTWEL